MSFGRTWSGLARLKVFGSTDALLLRHRSQTILPSQIAKSWLSSSPMTAYASGARASCEMHVSSCPKRILLHVTQTLTLMFLYFLAIKLGSFSSRFQRLIWCCSHC